jgi:segregation and condensation protein B
MPEKNKLTNKSSKNPLPLPSRIEAILFVAPGSTSIKQLADTFGVSTQKIKKALTRLEENLTTRGIRLQENKGRYLLTTAPEIADEVEFFLQLESTTRFSSAALETLAIVAYQQPVSRPGIDAIRGVNSDSVIRNLLSKGLIEEIGRGEGPGRPILYGTSPEFLQYFGLGSIKDLPEVALAKDLFATDPASEEQQELPLLKE